MMFSDKASELISINGRKKYYSQFEEIEEISDDINFIHFVWEWLMSITIIRYLFSFSRKLYIIFIFIPLFYLYLNSPSIWGIGGYSGQSYEDICHSIIGQLSSSFWAENEDNRKECINLILKRFNNILTGLIGIIYIIILIRLIFWLISFLNISLKKCFYSIFNLKKRYSSSENVLNSTPSPSYKYKKKNSSPRKYSPISEKEIKELLKESKFRN